jgi:hypothetical protein
MNLSPLHLYGGQAGSAQALPVNFDKVVFTGSQVEGLSESPLPWNQQYGRLRRRLSKTASGCKWQSCEVGDVFWRDLGLSTRMVDLREELVKENHINSVTRVSSGQAHL